MALVMTYGATVFTAIRDPMMGNYTTIRQWKDPSIKSGDGKLSVYPKNIVADIKTLTWGTMDPTDLTNILAFFAAVNWTGNSFDLTTPDGLFYRAHFIGPSSLQWTPEIWTDQGFTIDLFIVSRYRYLTDEAGNYLTDEDGSRLLVADSV